MLLVISFFIVRKGKIINCDAENLTNIKYFIGLQIMNIPKKKIAFLAAKLILALGLVYWLFKSGKIDLAQVLEFFKSPKILALNFLIWFCSPILLGAWRLHLILLRLRFTIKFRTTAAFQGIGLFFNTAMPGALGGDLVKSFLIYNHNKKNNMSGVLVSVLMDRIIGMVAIVVMGIFFMLGNLQTILLMPSLRPVIYFSFFLLCGLGIFLTIVFFPNQKLMQIIDQILNYRFLTGFKKIFNALKSLQGNIGLFFKGFCISLLSQTFVLFLFWFICSELGLSDITFSNLMIIYPIGTLITILPLAPGGLGVGHVAYEKLFQMVGAEGGANAFNLYFIGQMLLNLLGFLPFILLKIKSPKTVENLDMNELST